VAAAWRAGLLFSLFVSYLGLVIFIYVKKPDTPVDVRSPLTWLWAGFLILVVLRTVLQTLVEAGDLESSLKSLRRTLQVKAGLRYLSHAVGILGMVSPLFAFQGWVGLALWSKRALLVGRGMVLFEKWFDHRVHGELRRFIVASITAAVVETLLRTFLMILALGTAKYRFLL